MISVIPIEQPNTLQQQSTLHLVGVAVTVVPWSVGDIRFHLFYHRERRGGEKVAGGKGGGVEGEG